MLKEAVSPAPFPKKSEPESENRVKTGCLSVQQGRKHLFSSMMRYENRAVKNGRTFSHGWIRQYFIVVFFFLL